MKKFQIAFEYPNIKGAMKEYIEADGYFNNGLVEFYIDGEAGREIIAAYGISKVIRIKNLSKVLHFMKDSLPDTEDCKSKKK
jgi:hypothetical protein